MIKSNLDEFENSIEKNASDYTPVSKKKLEMIKDSIRNSNKTKTISLRVSENELNKIKVLAENEGLPYQTLISSVLHKYVNHRLIEEKEIERAIYLMKRKDFATV